MKVEINSKRKYRKYANIPRLNNTFLNDQQVIKEIRGRTQKFTEANENENTTYQNLWNTVKVVLRGKFIPPNAYIKKIRDLK
jgi:hypothetical protein